MVVVVRKPVDKPLDLMHHGIRGQKWGEKNGPPYPLDYQSHSSAEKKENPKLSIDGNPDTGKKRKGLNKETLAKIGKAALITAGVVAVGAVAYSALESGKFDEILGGGREFVADMIDNAKIPRVGKSFDQIDSKMVKSINAANSGTYKGSINCFHTTTSYIFNSVLGKETTALGFNGVDELSGAFLEGRDINLYKRIFNNIDINGTSGRSFSDVFSELKS